MPSFSQSDFALPACRRSWSPLSSSVVGTGVGGCVGRGVGDDVGAGGTVVGVSSSSSYIGFGVAGTGVGFGVGGAGVGCGVGLCECLFATALMALSSNTPCISGVG
jgi:hypothetical protein